MKIFFTVIACLLFIQVNSQPLVYDFIQGEGGIANADTRNDLVKDSNGNLILMGDFSGTRDFGGTSITAEGNTEIFVAKFNPSGSLIWVVNGGDSSSFANTGGLTVDASDNVYITGKYQGNFSIEGTTIATVANSDIFVAKLNGTNGNLVWLNTAGGNSIDEAFGIAHVGNNQVVICGSYAGSADFGSVNLNSGVISNINAFIAKYNSSGTVLWAIDAGGSMEDRALAVAANTAGELYVAGYFQGNNAPMFGTNLSSSGSNDIFLAKINGNNGNGLWARKAGGNGLDQTNSMAVNNNGDVFMTGIFYTTATFGSLSVTESSMAGDMFIVKYDNSGTALWVKKGGGTFQDKGNGVSAEPDANGSVYVTGLFAGNANFSGQVLSASGPSDAFIAKYNYVGNLIFVAKGSGPSNDQGKAVCAGVSGNFCMAGSFTGTALFGPNSLTSGSGIWETYFACVDGGTVGISESFTDNGIELVPNPIEDICTLHFKNNLNGKCNISVYSVQGKLVYTMDVFVNDSNQPIELDLSALESGGYILRIASEKYTANSKLIIQ